MPRVMFKQAIVAVKICNGNYYQIPCEEPSWTDSQSSDEYVASEKLEPYAVGFGAHEYSVELKGIDPKYRYVFEYQMKAQDGMKKITFKRMMDVITYCYDDSHKTQIDKHFSYCYIEEISKTSNEPFDVKIKALTTIED